VDRRADLAEPPVEADELGRDRRLRGWVVPAEALDVAEDGVALLTKRGENEVAKGRRRSQASG
jgi:hypothetical protein